MNLGHLSGTAYKTKAGIDGVRYDPQQRDLSIGQRDTRRPAQSSLLLGKVAERATGGDNFDANVWLDVTFPHVVFVCGRRGSGKSYDLGIIAEGIAANPNSNFSRTEGSYATVLFDLQSQFWTLGLPLRNEVGADQAQLSLIKQWRLEGGTSPAKLLLPIGSSPITGTEQAFSVPPASMELIDWLSLIGADRFDPMGQLLRTCLSIVTQAESDFAIDALITCLDQRAAHPDLARFQQPTVDALQWRLMALQELQLFAPGKPISDTLLVSGQASVVLLRELDDAIKSVLVAVTMRQVERAMSRYHQKLKVARRAEKTLDGPSLPSRAWILIDEAHLVCPAERKTPANEVIVDYVKRGRDAGLSLVLATQQPSALDSSAISQVDLSIIHRLTFEPDITAALQRLPSPMPKEVSIGGRDVSDPRILIRALNPGESIVSDAEASRSFIMVSRPRICPHGGGEPILE
jgi:DNA helicase HerA-like ATPase